MNKVLQTTKFSPSANSKILDPSAFLSQVSKHWRTKSREL